MARYTPEEIERGLNALVIAGSSPKASEVTGIPASTLREWKMDHADQYERLCEELEPRIVKKIAAESESIVLRLADLQHAYIDSMEASLHELKPGELPGAARNLATVSALYVDKHSSPLRERPSHVQQDSGVEQLTHQIARLLGKPMPVSNEAEPVEAEAVEIPLKTERDESNAPELRRRPD